MMQHLQWVYPSTYHDALLFSIPGWWGPEQDCLFLQAAEIVQRKKITKGLQDKNNNPTKNGQYK